MCIFAIILCAVCFYMHDVMIEIIYLWHPRHYHTFKWYIVCVGQFIRRFVSCGLKASYAHHRNHLRFACVMHVCIYLYLNVNNLRFVPFSTAKSFRKIHKSTHKGTFIITWAFSSKKILTNTMLKKIICAILLICRIVYQLCFYLKKFVIISGNNLTISEYYSVHFFHPLIHSVINLSKISSLSHARTRLVFYFLSF